MTRTRPFGVRALSSIAALSLAATGLAVISASPATAAPAVVYDSIVDDQPASYPSLGFQAQATWEFGDYVVLGGSNRAITDVTISLTSWACETGQWNLGDCETTPGSTFTHPVTMNLYDVDNTGSTPVAGDLIASVTNTVEAPFRPTPSPDECTQTSGSKPWWDPVRETCQNGFAFDVSFDFSGEEALVGNDVIVTVAYDTQSYGETPTAADGPYNALNVSLNNLSAPVVGTDEAAGEMFRDTTYSGSTRGLKASTLISIYNGLVMEITADSVPAIDPLTQVTVYERDVKPNETPETYTEWHEGQTSDRSTVFADGLHLGIGGPSTVIKGTDLTTPESIAGNTVTRAELRQLIERASVNVVSGTVTYQVPILFGNPAAPSFTTLRSTSQSAGTNTFSQADTWATTRAFGDYGVQETAPLGELIDAVFDFAADAGGGVVIAGYGVQADSLAVVSSVVWDDTRYTFTQPVIEACTPTPGTPVTNLAQGDWDFSQTRTQGTNVFTEDGLVVSTFGAAGSPDQRKAAGYVDIDIPLSEVGSVALDIAPGYTGVRPSLQLGFDADGNGTRDAYLVGEPWAYGGGDWTTEVNGDWADAKFWVTGAVGYGVPAGGGYPSLGTLDEYLLANPEARITEYGYSLGSGVTGSATIESITVGCVTTPFGFELMQIESCVPTQGPAVTNVTQGGWDFSQSRSQGTNVFTEDGLLVTTFDDDDGPGSPDQRKAAGYVPIDIALSEVGSVALDIAPGYTGVRPSLQLGFDADGNGTRDAYLVGEPWAYGGGSWTPTLNGDWADANFWVTGSDGFGVAPGGGYPGLGTLEEFLTANPDSRITEYGYSLGSGVVGEALIRSITVDCVTTPFSLEVGTFSLQKLIGGPAEELVPDGTIFTVEYSTSGSEGPWTAVELDSDGTVVTGPTLDTGTVVDFREVARTVDGLTLVSTTFSEDQITIGDGTTIAVTVTNSFEQKTGSFSLQKLVSDASNLVPDSTVFTVRYSVNGAAPIAVELTSGAAPVVVNGLATGSTVIFTEDPPTFDGVTWLSPVFSPESAQITIGDGTTVPVTVSNPFELTTLPAPTTDRLAGGDRYATAVEISKAGFADGEPDTVFIATGTVFADALSAAPAAAELNAPLLLTIPTRIPDVVLAELNRLAPSEIVIVGSTLAVSAAVETALEGLAFAPEVTRVFGGDRYATSRAVSDFAFDTATTAFLATGVNFPDALAAGPAAAELGGPVVLIPGLRTTVDAATTGLLDELGVTDVLIAGSNLVVSDAIETALDGDYTVTRLEGPSRYDTAIAINEFAFTDESVAYLATGQGFADALAGGALAANQGVPLYISLRDCLDADVLQSMVELGVTNIVLLGGLPALSLNVENLVICGAS